MHNEAFYLQAVVDLNAKRLTDTQSSVLAPPDERKYVILGEDNIREDMRSEV
jgi:hypothetical protein